MAVILFGLNGNTLSSTRGCIVNILQASPSKGTNMWLPIFFLGSFLSLTITERWISSTSSQRRRQTSPTLIHVSMENINIWCNGAPVYAVSALTLRTSYNRSTSVALARRLRRCEGPVIPIFLNQTLASDNSFKLAGAPKSGLAASSATLKYDTSWEIVEGASPCAFRVWQCSIICFAVKSVSLISARKERPSVRRELLFDEPSVMFGWFSYWVSRSPTVITEISFISFSGSGRPCSSMYATRLAPQDFARVFLEKVLFSRWTYLPFCLTATVQR